MAVSSSSTSRHIAAEPASTIDCAGDAAQNLLPTIRIGPRSPRQSILRTTSNTVVSSWRRGTNLTCSLALLVLVLVLTVLYLVWQVSCAGCHMAARRHGMSMELHSAGANAVAGCPAGLTGSSGYRSHIFAKDKTDCGTACRRQAGRVLRSAARGWHSQVMCLSPKHWLSGNASGAAVQHVQLSCQPGAGWQSAALEACWWAESVPACLQDAGHGGGVQQAPTAVAAATATPGLLAGGSLCDSGSPYIPSGPLSDICLACKGSTPRQGANGRALQHPLLGMPHGQAPA